MNGSLILIGDDYSSITIEAGTYSVPILINLISTELTLNDVLITPIFVSSLPIIVSEMRILKGNHESYFSIGIDSSMHLSSLVLTF